MQSSYEAEGRRVVHVFADGEREAEGTAESAQEAETAAWMLERAGQLNDRRKYTASARLYARVEEMLTGGSAERNCDNCGRDFEGCECSAAEGGIGHDSFR